MSSLSRTFKSKYIFALSLLGILVLLQQLIVQNEIDKQTQDASWINIAGRQRMLSQKITKHIYKNLYDQKRVQKDNSVQTEFTLQFKKDFSFFKKSHKELYSYVKSKKSSQEKLNKNFSDLHKKFKSFIQSVDLFVSLKQSERKYNDLKLKKISENEKAFLAAMEIAVGNLEEEARGRVKNLKELEKILFFVFVLTLILEGLFVFKPAVDDLMIKETQLRKSKDMAEDGVRTKARFLATMSHEIRTPMNAVLSCANLLLDSAKSTSEIQLLNTIKSSGDSLLTLINDILDFSKIESGKMDLELEPFDIRSISNEVVELLGSNNNKENIEISCKVDSVTPPWILGDATRFRQVLVNLVGNAIKFTETKVEIGISSKRLDKGKFKIVISVVDDGIGMSEENQAKLFKDFTQVDASTTRKFGGTGLGLSICKGIVEAMGGKIWVYSELEKGSKFSFSIVVQEVSGGHLKEKVKKALNLDKSIAAEHPLKILVAEDNSVNQMVIRKLLAKIGYRIDVVANGLEALKAVQTKSYDVILMDQHMPEMDGIEATKEIRRLGYDLKIFALTASAFKEDKERCLQAGMNGFLTKPIVMEELVAALKECGSPKEIVMEQDDQPLIDMAALQEQFEGMSDILNEIIHQYFSELSDHLSNIQAAIEEGDSHKLQVSAHTLKGAVANFRAELVVEAALKLEMRGREEDLADIELDHKNLKSKIEKLNLELKQILAEEAA